MNAKYDGRDIDVDGQPDCAGGTRTCFLFAVFLAPRHFFEVFFSQRHWWSTTQICVELGFFRDLLELLLIDATLLFGTRWVDEGIPHTTQPSGFDCN